MALSDEKIPNSSSSPKKSNFLPAIIILLVLGLIGGYFFFLNSNPNLSISDSPELSEPSTLHSENSTTSPGDVTVPLSTKTPVYDLEKPPEAEPTISNQLPENKSKQEEPDTIVAPAPVSKLPEVEQKNLSGPLVEITVDNKSSLCEETAERINQFYQHLDRQQYMKSYQLTTPSKNHFTALIDKLLANPPQVTRETDDLYTILKNTAHFFRVSGKDNIVMLKGILDSERSKVETILADYYFLITSPDCGDTPYVLDINQDALYEYACFFLNTMGGRLYLFRRDSLSRMVVTYYAISLINQANERNNNRHGIDLKPVIDMLIAEMEGGGANLKKQEYYLDTLYILKEKYQ